jgi:hypothetical protein
MHQIKVYQLLHGSGNWIIAETASESEGSLESTNRETQTYQNTEI